MGCGFFYLPIQRYFTSLTRCFEEILLTSNKANRRAVWTPRHVQTQRDRDKIYPYISVQGSALAMHEPAVPFPLIGELSRDVGAPAMAEVGLPLPLVVVTLWGAPHPGAVGTVLLPLPHISE